MNETPLTDAGTTNVKASSSLAPADMRNIALLDALRGLSALGVLVSHVHTTGSGQRSGAVFVDIFMVISGFLMTHHYILREDKEPWESGTTVQKFYLRRFFRIAPLYYCCLIYYFLSSWNEAIAQRDSVAWNAIQHFTFVFGFLPDPASTGMPDWSIGLEMQFYLVFPLLMLWVGRSGPVPLVILAGFISFAANRLLGVYPTDTPGLLGLYVEPNLLPLKFTLFTYGMLAAYFYWKRIKLAWPFIGLLAIASALPYKHGHSWFVMSVLGFVLMATQMPLIQSYARSGLSLVNDFCKNRLFHLLAEYSYAVYLIHGFAFRFVENRFGDVLLNRGPLYHWLFVLAMALIITYPLAFLLQHFIEKPGIDLGRRLCSRLSGPKLA